MTVKSAENGKGFEIALVNQEEGTSPTPSSTTSEAGLIDHEITLPGAGGNDETERLLAPTSSRESFSGPETEVGMLRSMVETLREEVARTERQRLGAELALRNDLNKSLKKQLELEQKIQSQENKIRSLENVNKSQDKKFLPADTFSFMLVCPFRSREFVFSLFVYLFQMATFLLVTLDMIGQGDGSKNPLGVPGDVSVELRAAQFIAILVAIFTQGDLMTAIEVYRDGYQEDLYLKEKKVDQENLRYHLSLFARASEGAVGLVVSFLLIITAVSVVELLLNFTAIEFVSKLDEIAFSLSKRGFVGESCKEQALVVQDIKYEVKKTHNRAWKPVMVMVILGSMLIGWGSVFRKQAQGHFLCKTIQVQFGDDSLPVLGTFSGLFDLKTKSLGYRDRRVEYVERRSSKIGHGKVGKFAFCEDISAWTFGWEDNRGTDSSDPCDIWVARSAPHETFDLTDTANLMWYSRDSTKREVELSLHLSCVECKSNADCNGEKGEERGVCNNAVCSCTAPWKGLRCEFLPCSDLSVDSQSQPFPGSRDWAIRYSILYDEEGEGVEAYHHPVYVHDYETKGYYDIILFTGRRWALTSLNDLPIGRDINVSKNDLAFFFKEEFHANHQNFTVSFLSEATDVGTAKDTASPTDLQWYKARSDGLHMSVTSTWLDEPVSSVLLCQICDNTTNTCKYDGVCQNDGSCKCSPGAVGVLCQDPPMSSGYCNTFFNAPEFKMDGGDCCESTCVSSEHFKCGYDSSGLAFSGYPACKEETDKWHSHGEILGGDFSRSGSHVAIAGNGAILALTENRNQVRLFDKDGSTWTERAKRLVIEDFDIIDIAISNGHGTLLNNPPEFVPPAVIGVSGVGVSSGNSTVFVYYCVLDGCELADLFWEQLDDEYVKTKNQTKAQFPQARRVKISGQTVAVDMDIFQFSQVSVEFSEGEFRRERRNALYFQECLILTSEDFGFVPPIRNDTLNDMHCDEFDLDDIYNYIHLDYLHEDIRVTGLDPRERDHFKFRYYGEESDILDNGFNGTRCLIYGEDIFVSSISQKSVSVGIIASHCFQSNAILFCDFYTAAMAKSELTDGEWKPVFNMTYLSLYGFHAFPTTSMSGDGKFLVATLDPLNLPTSHKSDWYQKSFVWNATEGSWLEQNDSMTLECESHISAGSCKASDGSVWPNNMTVVCRDRTVSDDGLTVVCETTGGSVATFDWNGVDWEQGTALKGASSSAINSDGTVLVLGIPDSQLNERGSTAVYSRSRSLKANESLFRVSYIPHSSYTEWDVRLNRTGRVIMEDKISSAWEVAGGTEEAIVSKNDCLVFTMYPTGRPEYQYNKKQWGETKDYGTCEMVRKNPPRYPLNAWRFDLFLDEAHVPAGKPPAPYKGTEYCSIAKHPDHSFIRPIPPTRVFLGEDCFKCAGETQQVQVMVCGEDMSVDTLEWNLTDSKGSTLLSSDTTNATLLLYREYLQESWGEEARADKAFMVLDLACLDVKMNCYQFSIVGRSDWFYSIMNGNEVVESFFGGGAEDADSATITNYPMSFGNCEGRSRFKCADDTQQVWVMAPGADMPANTLEWNLTDSKGSTLLSSDTTNATLLTASSMVLDFPCLDVKMNCYEFSIVGRWDWWYMIKGMNDNEVPEYFFGADFLDTDSGTIANYSMSFGNCQGCSPLG